MKNLVRFSYYTRQKCKTMLCTLLEFTFYATCVMNFWTDPI